MPSVEAPTLKGEGAVPNCQHAPWLVLLALLPPATAVAAAERDRLRVIVETDAGGDPDDEQSLVRFLLYANEWDVEGLIANRPKARDGENLNPERTGLGIVRGLLKAYGECRPSLARHDAAYPTHEALTKVCVAGYDDIDDGVGLIIRAVDRPDPRPVWYSDWGSDRGAATNNMKRALDRVLKERGAGGYAKFKSRLRMVTADKFGDHTAKIQPPFKLLVQSSMPEMDRQRWYHRFSPLTAKAGGFDLRRDVLTGRGPLGALYPTNTSLPQKEGDSMYFLYLVPNGLGDPEQPTWGGWGGRHGLKENSKGRPYYWANQKDSVGGVTSRDNTLGRWAADLQNDFRARLDWCVNPSGGGNHAPVAVVNGSRGRAVIHQSATPGAEVRLDAAASTDPDGDALDFEWFVYPEPGTYRGAVKIEGVSKPRAAVRVPDDAGGKVIHVVLKVRDGGKPALVAYRRIVLAVKVK
jgi:hypothetical protein